jgi:two-component system response regulator
MASRLGARAPRPPPRTGSRTAKNGQSSTADKDLARLQQELSEKAALIDLAHDAIVVLGPVDDRIVLFHRWRKSTLIEDRTADIFMIQEQPVEILLVEDNPSDAKLTIRGLVKSKVANQIEWVKDGQAAVDYLFCEGIYADRDPAMPQIVLLDIKLPKMDGLEVLERIRKDPRTSNLPVVLLTSSNQERDIARGYALRANSYIVKPVDFVQFADAVKSLGMYWLLLNTPPVLQPRRAPAHITTLAV